MYFLYQAKKSSLISFPLFPQQGMLAELVSRAAVLSPCATAERAALPDWQPLLEQHPSYNGHLEKWLEIQICGTSALLKMKLSYRFGI